MHKSISPVIPIELDKQRNLIFDFCALEKIEEALPGVSTFNIDFWTNLSAKRMVVACWAGLLQDDPALTLEDTRKFLRGVDPTYVTQRIMEAWKLSGPESSSEGGENPPQPETAK